MRVTITAQAAKYVVRVTDDAGRTVQRSGEGLHECVARLHNAGIADYKEIAEKIEEQGYTVFSAH